MVRTCAAASPSKSQSGYHKVRPHINNEIGAQVAKHYTGDLLSLIAVKVQIKGQHRLFPTDDGLVLADLLTHETEPVLTATNIQTLLDELFHSSRFDHRGSNTKTIQVEVVGINLTLGKGIMHLIPGLVHLNLKLVVCVVG